MDKVISPLVLSSSDRLKIPLVLKPKDANRLLAIQTLLDADDSWTEIERTLKVQSLYRWTKGKVEKIHAATPAQLSQQMVSGSTSYTKQSSPKTPKTLASVPIAVRQVLASKSQLPDYGELPPTGYVSPLNHDDWMSKYCGYTWSSPTLTTLRNEIWDRQKLMILEPRGHGKTWSMIGLFARWLLEKGYAILVFSAGSIKTAIFNGVLRALESDAVRQDYGDVIETSRRNQGEIWLLPRLRLNEDGIPYMEASFTVIGKLAQALGQHPSWIHLDDIIQEVSLNETTRQRINEWFARTVKYMQKKNTKVTFTGTRKDPNDFYNYIIEKHHYPILREEALKILTGRLPNLDEIEFDHETERLTKWPNVGTYRDLGCPDWPIARLLYAFIFHYRYAEAELNNNPIPPGGLYYPAHSYQEVDPLTVGLNYYTVVDPGFSADRRSSGSAIILVTIYKWKLYVVDSVVGKLTMVQLNKHVVDYHKRWKPRQTIIENNYAMITNKSQQFRGILRLSGLKLIMNYTDKIERIAALEFPLGANDILFYNTCSFKNIFETQMLVFDPTDTTKRKENYNALDVLMIAWDNLNMLVNARSPRSRSSVKNKLRAGTRSNR